MLSPEQFAELVAVIDTTQDPDHPKPNVRRAQRVSHPCRITISLGDGVDACPGIAVQLKDISARGICFIHGEALKRDTTFVVKLESPTGANVAVLSNVIHCHQLDKHTWQIGAEFTCVLGKQVHQTRIEAAQDVVRIRASILQ